MGMNELALPAPCISESCIKIKINSSFHFHTFCGVSFKTFIKPFEAPHRSVKIKT